MTDQLKSYGDTLEKAKENFREDHPGIVIVDTDKTSEGKWVASNVRMEGPVSGRPLNPEATKTPRPFLKGRVGETGVGVLDLLDSLGLTSSRAAALEDSRGRRGGIVSSFKPGTNQRSGTRRNYAFGKFPGRQDAFVEYDVTLSYNWSFGGSSADPTNEGRQGYATKLGFGLGGGSVPSGGNARTDGFLCRLTMSKGQLTVYYYGADQKGSYGTEILTGIHIKPGNTLRIGLGVEMNKSGESDGRIWFGIGGYWRVLREGVEFMRDVPPVVDHLVYSSFFGGSDGRWEPAVECTATYSSVIFGRGTGKGAPQHEGAVPTGNALDLQGQNRKLEDEKEGMQVAVDLVREELESVRASANAKQATIKVLDGKVKALQGDISRLQKEKEVLSDTNSVMTNRVKWLEKLIEDIRDVIEEKVQ